MRNLYLFASVMLIALIGAMGAQSATTGTSNIALSSFLSTYMPSGIITNSTYFNSSLNGNNYILMQLPASGGYIIVQSSNGAYSLITNTTTIDNLLTPFLINQYYPGSSTLNYLNSTMHMYQRYGASNVSDCLMETGLSQQTCTLGNLCLSCQTTPVCKRVLNQVGGPGSPFGMGIMNFSSNYNQLNSSYKNYYALLSGINRTNAGTTIAELYSIASNISTIASAFNKNPLFPPPTTSSFSSCPSGLPPSAQPWYCVAVGFCSTVPFNSTAISGIEGTLSSLQENIPTAAALSSLSFNSSQLSQGYINAALLNKNGAAFAALINSYSSRYGSIVNRSNALLLKYNNISLNASVRVLQTEFGAIKRLGVNQSIGVANTILASLIANTTRIYNNASASYSQIYNISQNSSAAILADQLSYQQVPSQLAVLGSRQAAINIRLNSRLSSNDIASIIPSAQSIRIEAAVFVAPVTIGYMIKILDTSFINALLSGSNATPPQRIALTQTYAAIESLIIGIVILLAIFIIVYLKVIKKGKLNGKRQKMVWASVFAIMAILVALYAYATFAYSGNANSFLPFNYFKNTLKASTTAYIALNGSAAANSSISACASTVQNYLSKAGKAVQLIKLTNYSCVSGSNISVLGLDCYNNILSSGKPVILMSQSRTSSIVYKGLYGTVLYASGNATSGSSCILSSLFRN